MKARQHRGALRRLEKSGARHGGAKLAAALRGSARAVVESLEARQMLSADVVISEIMYHPSSEQYADEWIELYNKGNSAADLTGWKLTKGVDYTFSGGSLGAGGYLVVAADVGEFSATHPGVSNVVGGWSGHLANSGEEVLLTNSTGGTIDQVTYANTGDWAHRLTGEGYDVVKSLTHSGTTATVRLDKSGYANGDSFQVIGADQSVYNGTFTAGGATGNSFTYTLPSTPSTDATGAIVVRRLTDHGHVGFGWGTLADGGGRSLELINPALTNNQGQNWTASNIVGGTPGGPNSVASANIAPMIMNVALNPLVPKSTDPVTVTATLSDETGATGATVFWRLDAASPGAFNAVSMHDDGLSGDTKAGDGVWTAQIPPQANGKIVEVYLTATDGTLTRSWPSPVMDANGNFAQSANLLYQVDDTTYAGTQPEFKLIMTQNELAELTTMGNTSPDSLSDAAMNSTFISIDPGGSEARYAVEVRNHGHGSRTASINNYRINLNSDNPWKGLNAITLNAQYSMEDIMGSAVMREAGVPAQNVIPVQVRVNSANLASTSQFDMFGSYSFVETEGSEMVNEHFPTDNDGNYYRGEDDARDAKLQYLGSSPANISTYHVYYPKQTNAEIDDYSDIINLLKAFDPTQTPDAQFVAAMEQNIDVQEWLLYFAVDSLIGNRETALGNGYGDDYSLYSGVNDPRFLLIAHDLDTILGSGTSGADVNRSVFLAGDGGSTGGSGSASIKRLLENPAFSAMYYQTLVDLINTTFAPDNMAALIDQVLPYAPESARDTMKSFVTARDAAVLMQIPRALSVTSTLAQQNGYYHATANTTSLSGNTDVTRTKTVLVNGQPANYAYNTTTHLWSWTAPNVSLRNGINRVLVQALDNNGQEILRTYIDIWSEQSAPVTVNTGMLAGNTHWTQGVYHVTGASGSRLTIPAGSSLTIDPGTTVFFDSGTGLAVSGQLTAVGTDLQRIRLTEFPGSSGWAGIQFTNTPQDSRIAHADQEFCTSTNITANNSRFAIDDMTWPNTTAQVVNVTTTATTQDTSWSLTNSHVPGGSRESVHFDGPINDASTVLIQGNHFDHVTNYNDSIDFTGGDRPGHIAQFLDNIFDGGDDDGLDLDRTDAYIAGNIFRGYHLPDPTNVNPSSAISGGAIDQFTSELTVVGNIFYDVDHAVTDKEGNYDTIVNNTMVGVRVAAVSFDEPGRSGVTPGRGAYLDGNIMWDMPAAFGNVNDSGTITDLTVNRSILPGDTIFPGIGNSNLDPNLLHSDLSQVPDISQLSLPAAQAVLRAFFALAPEPGPAVGTGPNGRDMGALVPRGASISGEPLGTTASTSATITVGGPDIYAYEWKLDNGQWSAPVAAVNIQTSNPIVPPIQLTNLSPGPHVVYVVEENSASFWQDQANPSVSKTWIVDPSYSPKVRINEVLASNTTALNHEGTFPDAIELYNPATTVADLSGMSISDDPASPTKFIFPEGTTIPAGGYLVLYADSSSTTSGIHLGFSLKSSGEEVHLYDTAANGGAEIDGVVFGQQLDNNSIGRLADGTWGLTQPTLGSANIAQPVGDSAGLKINEWLTKGLPPYSDDFIEIYNPDTLPVNMGGFSVTDQATGWPDKNVLKPLSFVSGSGFMVLQADGQPNQGDDHTNFKLSSDQGEIALFDPAGNKLDIVAYATQVPGVSQGRSPDGSNTIVNLALPTPGVSNPGSSGTTITQTYNLVNITDVWKYNEAGNNLGTAWIAPAYNDSQAGWAAGGGLLYVESSALPAPKTTPLVLTGPGKSAETTTFYFRIHFNLSVLPSVLSSLALQTVLDDGAAVYLNGDPTPVFTLGMPATFTATTFANRNVDNAKFEGPFELLPSNDQALRDRVMADLKQGDNVLAVEVHQTNATSSDIVWGATLQAAQTIQVTNSVSPIRVTELNYNPPAGGGFTSDDYEYIELKNTGNQPINLAGTHFAAGVDFTFGNLTLNPGAVTLVVKNQAAFEARYGTGLPIAGQYTGALDDTGEEIRLIDGSGGYVQDFAYANVWQPSTDGQGHTLQINDPTADPLLAWRDPANWHASASIYGSPGVDEPALPADAVVVNEVLSHSHQTETDWIELHNTTASPIDISGWYLTDSGSHLNKYRIPDNTILPADGYLTVDESLFDNVNNPSDLVPFALSEAGDSVYISSANPATGTQTGYHQGWDFGAAATGVTFGRYQRSTGDWVFTAMQTPTPAAANSAPKFGPIVMNEVMYHPLDTGDEYIELKNVSNADVPLYDPLAPANTWQFTNGIDFAFPAGVVMPAQSYALVVGIDPAAFRAKYSIPSYVQIFGPYTGALDNSGEKLELSSPGDTELGVTPYIVQDAVDYGDSAPWPDVADGGGASLERLPGDYGDDVASWAAQSNPTPGSSAGDAIISGTGGDDTITVQVNGSNLEVFVNAPVGGNPTFTYPLSSTPSLFINGLAGNDTLDLASAIPFLPQFDGGTGSNSYQFNGGSYSIGVTLPDPNLSLTVNDATVQLNAPQQLGALSINAGGVVDLVKNNLILSYTGASPLAAIQQYAHDGQLIASQASDPSISSFGRTLAVWDNNETKFGSFDGVNLPDFDQVLVKYTYFGDANLDGQVTPTDYAIVDGNIGPDHDWSKGDLNGDGSTTPADYALIDGNIGAGNGTANGGPQLAVASGAAGAAATAAALDSTTSGPALFSVQPITASGTSAAATINDSQPLTSATADLLVSDSSVLGTSKTRRPHHARHPRRRA